MPFKKLLVAALGSTSLTAAFSTAADAQQLAFPTAEGFGRFAQGGRGGAVFIVSNLNDSGPGSLRACAEATGARTCVFSVSGEIRTQSRIRVRSGHLTIAGQTAPGGGVVLTNRGTANLDSPLDIQADHVIIRHMRFRPGPSTQTSDNVDAILIDGENIIIDHASFSWGTDETLNVVGNGGTSGGAAVPNTRNLTIQWSMIYESLRNSTHTSANHSRSTYLGYATQDVSFHHNLIAHSQRRNPNLGTVGQVDWVNNVVYNAQQYFGELYNRHGTSNVNWIGNVAQVGPDTLKHRDRNAVNIFLNDGIATHRLYVKDNLDMNRTSSSQDERLIVDPKDWGYIKAAPVGTGSLSLAAASISGPQQAYKDVLSFAGATKPARDAADARVANEVRTCAGGIIDDPSERGGWPALAAGVAPADADRDGMADSWETARGLSPSNAADRNADRNGDGYTNLEEYLNELAGDNAGSQVGRGSGPDPNLTCGYSLGAGANPQINLFTATPLAVRPGGTVTLTYSAKANTCKRSWPSTLPPTQTSGTETVIINETTQFDLICTDSGQDDWITRAVFVTPDGVAPKPVVSLTSNKTSYASGEPVTLTWMADRPRASSAGECVATGGWSGVKAVIGQETFPARYSGDYQLVCSGPGGSGANTVRLSVAGGAPAPTPGAPPSTAPTLSIDAITRSVAEGNSGSTAFTFTVTRSGSAAGSASVRYSVVGSTRNFAGADDFAGGAFPSGVVNFAANETSKPIVINVAGDTAVESDESFTVQLSSPAGAAIAAPDNATAEIRNDDSTPAPPPSPRSPVTSGQTVTVSAGGENIRATPGGARIGIQLRGAKGVVIAGPSTQDGINWLKVDFNTGADGWVRERTITVQ